MSTRGTVVVKEEGKAIVKFYNHSDSYPSGLGVTLAEFLLSGDLVNGLSGDKGRVQFNGAGCFAAALVAKLKDGPGGVYLIASVGEGQEYNYVIDIKSNVATISCKGHESIDLVDPAEFLRWAEADGKAQ